MGNLIPLIPRRQFTVWGVAFSGGQAWLMGAQEPAREAKAHDYGWRPFRWTRHPHLALPFPRSIDAWNYADKHLPHSAWCVMAIPPQGVDGGGAPRGSG